MAILTQENSPMKKGLSDDADYKLAKCSRGMFGSRHAMMTPSGRNGAAPALGLLQDTAESAEIVSAVI
jgi:hypothetical protein